MKIAMTGGHLAPALTIAEALLEKDQKNHILFFGVRQTLENDSGDSLEYQTISKIPGIEFFSVTSGKWQRYFTWKNLLTPFLILLGFLQATLKLLSYQPQVIVSFGSYLSVPVVVSGWLLRIPVVIHEQTLEGGLANRLNAVFATRVLVSFTESQKFFPQNKTMVVGNPLRAMIINPKAYPELVTFLKQNACPPAEQEKLPVIFVTGGNQGAHFINENIEDILPLLLEKFLLIHQCGSAQTYQDFERLKIIVKKLSSTLQNRYLLTRQFDPDLIGAVYQKADLVISRGGVNSISEILYFQKKAVIIPLPFSQKNEQLKNALFLKSSGWGDILEQKDLSTPDVLLKKIEENIVKPVNIRPILGGEFNPKLATEKIIKQIYESAKTPSGLSQK